MQTFILISENADFIDFQISGFVKKLKISAYDLLDFNYSEKIGIDDIKEIIKTSTNKPFRGDSKLAVIRNFALSSFEAQNSILKFLEEQPDFLTVILTSNNSQNILPTILSRTQIVSDLKRKPYQKIDLIKILESSLAQKLLFIQKNITSKEEALIFLSNLISTLENFLISDDPVKEIHLTRHQVADLLKKSDKALRYIENNLNFKHVVDVLLIGFPKSP